ncbi:MAG: hypothetical protein KGP14_03325 [Betaproteobacteria bacterium]|nr:hypothetical protein [Betaproteobacteria bacterium]
MVKFYDRVKEITATLGTGAITLAGPLAGFRSFASVLTNGDTCYYAITEGVPNWEVGIGTYNANILTRTTVLSSSNAGSPLNLSIGAAEVFLDLPASYIASGEQVGNKGVANGYVGLDANILIPFAQLPNMAGMLLATQYDINGNGSLYVKGDSDGVTGGTDDAPAITALIAAATAANKAIYFPARKYRIGSTIKFVSGLTILCAPGATFVKTFQGDLFNQASYALSSNKVSNLWIADLSITTPDQTVDTYAGGIFRTYGDNNLFRNVTIQKFGGPTVGGFAWLLSGNNNRIENPLALYPNTAIANAGIRILAGDSNTVIGGAVWAGDDALIFEPSIVGTNANDDSTVSNSAFIGVQAFSYNAHEMSVFVGNQTNKVNVLPPCTASVIDCSFIGIKCPSAAAATVSVFNFDSSGKISGLRFINCDISGTNGTGAIVGGFGLWAYKCSGGIDGVTIDNCDVRGPVNQPAIYISGRSTFTPGGAYDATLTAQTQYQPIKHVRVNGCRLEAPAAGYAINAAGIDGLTVSNCVIVANGQTAVILGAAGTDDSRVSNALFDNNRYINVPNLCYGITEYVATRVIVRGGKFDQAAGATTAGAVKCQTVSGVIGGINGLIDGCDVTGLSYATPFTNELAQGNFIDRVNGYTIITPKQLRAWAAANGSPLYIYTLDAACPADIADPVNIQWNHGNRMTAGDALYNFITSTLGFTSGAMTSAVAAMQAFAP